MVKFENTLMFEFGVDYGVFEGAEYNKRRL